MAELSTDILMTVTGVSGPIKTDSNVTFASRLQSDDLTNGFVAKYIFELREFSFSAGAAASLAAGKDKDKAKKDAEGAGMSSLSGIGRHNPLVGGALSIKGAEAAKVAEIAKARQSDTPDMQPIEFTRLMDSASAQLCKALTGCQTLPAVAIVKRKAAGTLNGGEAFLRLDFSQVLLIGLEWKESNDVVEETVTFIYRKLKISYRPQSADGTLGSAVTADWSMQP